MPRTPGIRRWFRAPELSSVDREVDDELRFHFEMRTRELVAAGMTPEAARAEAERAFGDLARWRERLRRIDRAKRDRDRRDEWWGALARDLRYAARGLRMHPGFAAVVVLTLALGVGANAIMFGVVDRLFFRPPAHVADPARVSRLYIMEKPFFGDAGAPQQSVPVTSYPALAALARVPAFEAVAGMFQTQLAMGRGADAQEMSATLVTGSFFRLLGPRPALGRFFTDEEDRLPTGTPVAVLGYGAWRSRFGGDRGMLGRTVRLGNTTFTVIGVAPRGFTGVDLEATDLWVPLSALAASAISPTWAEEVGSLWIKPIARLKLGVTPERAGADATAAYRAILAGDARGRDTLGRVATGPLLTARNPADATPESRVSVWLAGVSGIVLLIACANIANLLLARAVRRRRELAVRLALGVGRGGLVRQLLAETLLLAALSAGTALAVVQWGGGVLRAALLPTIEWEANPVDGRVLLFTGGVALLAGLLAGLAPALRGSRTDLASALKAGTRQCGLVRSRLGTALLIAQASLSLVLLVGAGLFVRSLREVRGIDAGIDLPRVLLARMDLRRAGYQDADARRIYEDAAALVRRLPGVERTALSAMSTPLRMVSAASLKVPGRDSLPQLPTGGPYHYAVSADFFAALGTRILRGRGFTEADERPGTRVVVVNETLARAYWPGANPLGACVTIGDDTACTEVVGVAEDIARFQLIGDQSGQFYVPRAHPFVSDAAPQAMVVRTAGPAAPRAEAVRRAMQSVAPDLPYASVVSFEQLVAPQVRPWQLGASMFGIFGALALVIAAAGLYSVIAYAVAQRTHEMGVRIALGAMPRDVARLIVAEGMRVTAAGLALGAAAALAAGRWVAPLLYRTSPHDPAIFATVALVLLAVAAAASLVPAWRAARVDPVVALRAE